MAAARNAGSLVLYLTDAHLPDDLEFRAWPAHAVRGTEGGKVIERLAPEPQDVVVPKRRFSGFFGTELDLQLRERRIQRLVLTGVLTDICVYHTAVDAVQMAYEVLVAKNAVAAATQEDHDFAIAECAADRAIVAQASRLCVSFPAKEAWRLPPYSLFGGR
jgi:nicotinamidase-related amidase